METMTAPSIETEQDHSLGMVAAILGGVGFVVNLCAIAGIIVGIVAINKPAPEGSSQPRLAKLGIILGSIALVLNIIIAIIVFTLVADIAA